MANKKLICTKYYKEFKDYVTADTMLEPCVLFTKIGAFTESGRIYKICTKPDDAKDMHGFEFIYLESFSEFDLLSRDTIFRLDAECSLRYNRKSKSVPYTPSRHEEGDISG